MNSLMDIEKIENAIEKMKIYHKQEMLLFEELKNIIEEFKYDYNTVNSKELSKVCQQLTYKFNEFIRMHENTIYIFNKNAEKYKDISIQVSNKFRNIVK